MREAPELPRTLRRGQTGSLCGRAPAAARRAGRGSSSSQSARAPWRPEPGTGCLGRRDWGAPCQQSTGGARRRESSCQRQAQASRHRPCRASPSCSAHSRHVPVFRACSRGAILASERGGPTLPARAGVSCPFRGLGAWRAAGGPRGAPAFPSGCAPLAGSARRGRTRGGRQSGAAGKGKSL